MSIPAKLTAATAALVLGVASAAWASGTDHGRSQNAPGHNKSQQTTASTSTTSSTTTTTRTPSSNGNAFGRFCQSESKKHVAGEKGTPFSKCVTDLAHMGNHSSTNPARACANESKRHVAGQPGTPFSQCVSAAAKLRSSQGGS